MERRVAIGFRRALHAPYLRCLLLLLFFSPGMLLARPTARDIASALTAGSADQVAQWFSGRVDLTLLDEQGVYPASQARAKLSAFFSAHRPQGFEVAFTNSRGERVFIIGNLRTSTGTYRVNIFLQAKGDGERITQLQICESS